jgi:hypothetical protein
MLTVTGNKMVWRLSAPFELPRFQSDFVQHDTFTKSQFLWKIALLWPILE